MTGLGDTIACHLSSYHIYLSRSLIVLLQSINPQLRPFGLGPRLILPGDKSLRRVDLGREDTGAEAEQNITVNQGLDRVNCIR